jgi:hypothetical protein
MMVYVHLLVDGVKILQMTPHVVLIVVMGIAITVKRLVHAQWIANHFVVMKFAVFLRGMMMVK